MQGNYQAKKCSEKNSKFCIIILKLESLIVAFEK